ncbi:MAG: tyrosine-type recombinase/integrase [Casimicrobiaceae bacterium]
MLGQAWTYFGEEYVAAVAAYAAWRHDGPSVETVEWLLDLFVGQACPGFVRAGRMAARTARDYRRDAEIVKRGMGKIPLAALQPKHVAQFADVRAQDAPSHVRNELACLSAALSYGVKTGRVATNVAMQVSRPSRKIRQRLITDSEYLKVYEKASDSVQLAMTLAIRTLALPADVLTMGPRNLIRYPDGRRTLRFARGKTGIKVEIELVGPLLDALQPLIDNPTLHPTFVRRNDGKPYTVDGIGAMFRRYCDKDHANVSDFGLRDLRAKGATDMYRADPTKIHQLQRLLGHKSITTTEIYLKGLLAEIVRPNERPIIGLIAK